MPTFEALKIIVYPDPRLRRSSAPVTEFNADLAALAARMFELMRLAGGVGLAAPQVGMNVRMFISNHSGKTQSSSTPRKRRRGKRAA
jgi:peptide deformylase